MKRIINFLKTNRWLGIILVVGTILRFYRINLQSLWFDELYSIVPTAPDASIQSIIDYCKGDQPPLFFLIIHLVFKILGYNEFIGRSVSACFGIISIVAIYFLGKEVKNKEVGLFASFLTAINFFHIYYSQELRFYTLVFLLSVLSYLFFIKAYKNFNLLSSFLYIISTVALLYTHYYGLFIFGSQGAIFIWLVIREKRYSQIAYGVAVAVIISVAYLPWIPTILRDLSVPTASLWIKQPSPFFVAEYFYDYTGKEVVTTIIFIALISVFVKDFFAHKSSLFLILILWIVFCYVTPYLRSVLGTPILHERYTIIVLPAWFLVFGLGYDKIQNRNLKYSLVGMLLIALAVNLLFFKKYYIQIAKEEFRESSRFVILNNGENYPIYAPDPLPWHYSYYFLDQPNKVRSLSEISADKKFWLLQGHFSDEQKEVVLQTLSDKYFVVARHSFYKADAYLMQHR